MVPEVIPTLDVLWRILHFPRHLADTRSQPAVLMRSAQDLFIPHKILLYPASKGLPLYNALRPDGIAVIIYPDEISSVCTKIISKCKTVIAAAPFSQVTADWLAETSKAIHIRTWGKKIAQVPPFRTFLPSNWVSAVNLPTLFLDRNIRKDGFPDLPDNSNDAFGWAVTTHGLIQALETFEREGRPKSEVELLLNDAVEESICNLEIPIAVVIPGGSPTYRKLSKNKISKQALAAEDSALQFTSTHHALARCGTVVCGTPLGPEAFAKLAQLEQHWQTGRPRAHKIWRLIEQMGAAVRAQLSDTDLMLLRRAKNITAFSDFPIGLLTLPDDSSPLACRTPIAYRPLTPLTRSMQFETQTSENVVFYSGLKIVVAECISKDEAVGQISRVGWEQACQLIDKLKGVTVRHVEINSVKDLQKELKTQYDILILSAHGEYRERENIAGIVCGKEFALGVEFPSVPPLVIFSSCSVAPRGRGCVSISDLFMRNGAYAVLGTLIPVDVMRNSILMSRFLTYVHQSINLSWPTKTVAEAWHQTLSTNAINDVVLTNPKIMAWALTERNGITPLVDFMLNRSAGRLRGNHAYKDTISILREIAVEHGIAGKFDGWAASKFLPESLFYTFLGSPEQLLLQEPGL